MYVTMDREFSRQHREEIMHEVALARLERKARANREGEAGLLRILSWELARFAGLLGKRLRNSH